MESYRNWSWAKFGLIQEINQWDRIEIGHRLNLDQIKGWIPGVLLGRVTPHLDLYAIG